MSFSGAVQRIKLEVSPYLQTVQKIVTILTAVDEFTNREFG